MATPKNRKQKKIKHWTRMRLLKTGRAYNERLADALLTLNEIKEWADDVQKYYHGGDKLLNELFEEFKTENPDLVTLVNSPDWTQTDL